MLRYIPLLLAAALITAPAAMAQITIFEASFDAVTAPAAPAGWTLDSGWETSTSSASTGSGQNNLAYSSSAPGSATLPPIDLSGATSATTTFLARRTSTFAADSLSLTASIDGGATFSIAVIARGGAVPIATSTWETVSASLPAELLTSGAILRFEGYGSGGNARFDDVAVTATGISFFGYSSAADTVLEETDTVRVPVYLDFDAAEGLQGLQFRVDWSMNALSATGVERGSAVADPAAWSLESEAGSGYLNVVLLGGSTAQLATARYDPLLTLVFRTDSVAADTSVAVALSEVVGGLASPEAGDAVIRTSPSVHTMTIRPRVAFFTASADSIGVGALSVGDSAAVTLTVSNPAATIDLDVGPITSDNPLFRIEPASATIAPDAAANFTIRFTPTMTAFGAQRATFSFSNNSENATVVIPVSATGLGGRGDAEGDGAVDVLDLVHSVDFVLERLTPTAAQTTSADLYPFSDGDGAVDIRDLIVLVHALARGYWPDSVDLPEEFSAPGAGKAGGFATVAIAEAAEASTVEMAYDQPIRGFQMILRSERELRVQADGLTDGTLMLTGFDELDREMRIVVYRTDGGTFHLSDVELSIEGSMGRPVHVVVVDADRRRVPVEISFVAATAAENVPGEGEGMPYPNPFTPGVDALRIPVAENVRIVDVLGREVVRLRGEQQWNGRDGAGTRIPSGLYFLIIDTEGRRVVRRVVAY